MSIDDNQPVSDNSKSILIQEPQIEIASAKISQMKSSLAKAFLAHLARVKHERKSFGRYQNKSIL